MQEQDIKRVYDVTEIQSILGIGRTKAYKFLEEIYLNQTPFTVLKIGKLYKVPKESFDSWMSGKKIDNFQEIEEQLLLCIEILGIIEEKYY